MSVPYHLSAMPGITCGFARCQPGGQLEVRARVDALAGPWWLDSAAPCHVLDARVHPVADGDTPVIHLGQYAHHGGPVAAMELPFSASNGAPLHGLLGAPLFRETAIALDWERQVLTLDAPAPAWSGHLELPLEVDGGLLWLPVHLGGEPLRLRLETASAAALVICQPDFDIARFAPPEEEPDGAVQFKATGLLAGVIRLPEWPAVYRADAEAEIAGSLGLGVLQRYQCWIDAPGGRLWLLKRG